MFKLDNSPKITKEFLLSKNSQETYFEHYLGVPVKKGLFRSPSIIRNDSKPTCAFYKNRQGILKYKDFAGPTFDFVGCVMYIFDCSYYKALRIIANDFGLIEAPNLEKNITKIEYSGNVLSETKSAIIQVEIKDFSEKELNWWNSFGISKKTLNKYKVYSVKSIFLNGNYFSSSTESSPVYGYFGGVNSEDIELWRLYMPTKRNYRFLSNWNANMLQGSRQVPKSGNHYIISKSMKDTMLLYEFGFISSAPTSENILLSKAQVEKIKSKFTDNLFVFFDNDLAGVRGAHKYKKEHGFKCIFIKRKYAKDISDLYKKVSSSVFWEIVEELNNIINDKTISKTKHFYVF